MNSSSSPINGLTYAPEWSGTNIFMACRAVSNEIELLYVEERPAIEKAGELRRKTFSSGRRCARDALAQAGLPPGALPKADDGSIIWPEGVIGSLSHTNEWTVSAVAVAAMSEACAIGCDLERIQPLEEGVLKLISTDSERTELAETGNTHWHATALFSMKESIYKCLRPGFGRFIEFHDVTLDNVAGGRPQVRFNAESLRAYCNPADLEVRMAVTPEHVFTLAWLRADGGVSI